MNGTLKNHVGYTNPNNTLPECASAQYERTTYVDKKFFHQHRERDYVINRAPADEECQKEIWKQYQTWTTKLEAEFNMTLAELWA